MNFLQKLKLAIEKNNSLLCIGLDTDQNKLPKHLFKKSDPIFEFNKTIIDKTSDLVCAYKPNIAYYEACGIESLKSLKKTVEYLQKNYPEIPIICDAKRADIGSTSEQYAKSIFDYFGFDAITVNPYLGYDAIEPFLKYKNKGIIILCRTSNPGASDFQDLTINNKPLYLSVAQKIISWNKTYKNCLMVVGATYPQVLKNVRNIAKDMFFLVPGVGSQGADLKKTLKYGLTKTKIGLIINVSRAIIYADTTQDFGEKAREKAEEIRDTINKYR